MHAITVLREDHERISVLLEAWSSNGDSRSFERLARELEVHMLAEDNIFLPQIEDAIEDIKRTTEEFFEENAEALEEASGEIQTAYDNHYETRALLASLRRGEEVGDEFRDKVKTQLEDEERLFPKAEKVLEEEDFERIGDLIEHCKWQVRGMAQASLASSSGFKPASA